MNSRGRFTALSSGILGAAVLSAAAFHVQAEGICDRTPQVRDALVSMIGGGVTCAEVTDADLAGIVARLDLERQRITTLKEGDFAGLVSLRSLSLRINRLSTLPATIFSDLDELVWLVLWDNNLRRLPPGVFSGLDNLTYLDLDDNGLEELSAGVFSDLRRLVTLDLRRNSLRELPQGVFSGLGSLNLLYLQRNRLEADGLPAGMFSGLGNLSVADLNNNPGAPFRLTLKLESVADDSSTTQRHDVRLRLREGSPFDVSVRLLAQGATVSPERLTFPVGSIQSEVITVTRPRLSGAAAVVTPELEGTSAYRGVNIVAGPALVVAARSPGSVEGVCDRTPQVRDEILARLSAVHDCAAVTREHLAQITSLNFYGRNILNLFEYDFAGLENLNSLILWNNRLSTLPASIFAGLDNLSRLDLDGNRLTGLREDVFSGLGDLEVLDLRSNRLEALPPGLFSGLDRLLQLFLQNNRLEELPPGIFSGLRDFSRPRASVRTHNNPGTPFEFRFDFERVRPDTPEGAEVRLVMPQGALFDIPISFLTQGWTTVSPERLTFPAGSTRSGVITVTYTGAAATVEPLILRPENPNPDFRFIAGAPLVLGSPAPPEAHAETSSVTTAGLGIEPVETVEGGTAEIAVTLAPLPRSSSVVISYRVIAGTADAADYDDGALVGGVGTVTVESGEATGVIRIPIVDDNDIEAPRESFTVVLIAPAADAGYVLGPANAVEVIIKEGVCDRTPQVRDGIVNTVFASGDDDCTAVTQSHLTRLSRLDLDRASISALREDDFSGLKNLWFLNLSDNKLRTLPANMLSGMRSLLSLDLRDNQLQELPQGLLSETTRLCWLYLQNNRLNALPPGLFSGLTALFTVDLSGNPGEPFDLALEFEGVHSADSPAGLESTKVRLVLREGAPFSMAVSFSAQGATLSSERIRFPAGATHSGAAITVTRTGAAAAVVTPVAQTDSFVSGGFRIRYSGLRIVAGAPLTMGELAPPPAVNGVEIVSAPREGDTYAPGEELVVAVSFDGPVSVTSSSSGPALALEIGETPRTAVFDPVSSSTTRLVFRYALAQSDFDDDGVSIPAAALRLNGARIENASGLAADLDLGDYAILNAAGHKVRHTPSVLSLGSEPVEVTEGGIARIAVTVTPPRPLRVFVGYHVIAGTADAADYNTRVITDGAGTAELLPGAANGSIRIPIVDDSVIESPRESFTVALTEPAAGADYVLGDVSTAAVTIKEGVCDRSLQVQYALIILTVGSISDSQTCADVTGDDLAGIGGTLNFQRQHLVLREHDGDSRGTGIALKQGDFSGLVNLEGLNLADSGLHHLPQGVFSGLDGLRDLDLADNGLSTLAASIFSGLTNLSSLDLSDNQLPAFPADVFSELTSLEMLWAHGNSLSALSPDVFSGLADLSSLWLNDNDLSTLPAGVFSGLTKLSSLRLDDNPGAPFEFRFDFDRVRPDTPESAEARLVLREGSPFDMSLEFSAQGATVSPEEMTFPAGGTQSGVITVTRTGVGAAVVTPAVASTPVFSGFRFVAGAPLVMGSSVSPGDDAAAAPATVGLGSEPVEVAEGGTAEIEVAVTPPQLSSVVVGYRVIDDTADASDYDSSAIVGGVGTVSIEPGATSGFIRISIVDDADVESPRESFTVELTEPAAGADYVLGPVSTATVTITEGVCDRTPQLREGIVAAVSDTDDCADVTSADLAKFNGSWNLRGRDITALKPGDFSGFVNLKKLNLRSNQLSTLPASVFSGLDGLQNLILWDNELLSLPADVFSGLGELERLDLDGNRLTSLPADVFSDLNNLLALDLRRNMLEELPQGVFSSAPSLCWLYLQDNELTELPTGMFSGLAGLVIVQMHDNPGSPFDLRLEFEGASGGDSPPTLESDSDSSASTEVRLVLREGSPFNAAVSFSAQEATVSPERITFAAGSTQSEVITVTRTSDEAVVVTAEVRTARFVSFFYIFYSGFQIVAGAPLEMEALIFPPAVSDVAIISAPREGDAYAMGEEIAVRVSFDQPVSVTSTTNGPALALGIGEATRAALSDPVSDSTTGLVFRYTLSRFDFDADGVSVAPDALTLNDARIEGVSGLAAELGLGDYAILNAAGHKVRRTPPLVGDVEIISAPREGDAYAMGEEIAVVVSFDEPVSVTPSPNGPALGLGIGEAIRAAVSDPVSGSTIRLVFRYTLVRSDFDADGVSVAPGALTLNGARVESVRGLAAELGLGDYAILNAAGHKVRRTPAAFALSLEPGPVEAVEGGTAEIEVVVTPSQPARGVFGYRVVGGTADALDYQDGAIVGDIGIVEVEPGDATGVIRIPIVDDDAIEAPRESFTVELVEPPFDADYVLGPVSTATVVIKEGVCDRTPRVRSKILAGIPGVSDCAEATLEQLGRVRVLNFDRRRVPSLRERDFADLSGLTQLSLWNAQLNVRALPPTIFSGLYELISLNLNNNGLEELSPGLFSDLTKLVLLDLRNNNLESLPPGIFSGLANFVYLNLRQNPGATFELPVDFERVRPDTPESAEVRLVLLEGAPHNVPVSFSAQGATVSPEQARIPAGSTQSGVITVTRTGDTTVTVTQIVEVPFSTSGIHVVAGAPLVMESLIQPEAAAQGENGEGASEGFRGRSLAGDFVHASVLSREGLSLMFENVNGRQSTVTMEAGSSAKISVTTQPPLEPGERVSVVFSTNEGGLRLDRQMVTLDAGQPSAPVWVFSNEPGLTAQVTASGGGGLIQDASVPVVTTNASEVTLQATPATVRVVRGRSAAEFTLTTSPLLGAGQEVQVLLSFDTPVGVLFDDALDDLQMSLPVTLSGGAPSKTIRVSARREGEGMAEIGSVFPVSFSVPQEQGVTVTPPQAGESLLRVKVVSPGVKLRIRVFLENALE